MLRSAMAVIVGYIVMAVIAVPIFLGAYVVPDLVWEKDAARTTLGFNLLTLVAGLVGALVGGFVCQLVARQRGKPPVVLAVLVLLMGLSSALMKLNAPAPAELNPEELVQMTPTERAMLSREPIWYSFTVPLIGGVGILGGAHVRRRRKTVNETRS